jgi:hypothetical protein
MSRVARVTEYIGRGDGGFYVEAPDIPEGLTCQEWRRRRAEARSADRPQWRPVFSWPALRPPRIRRPKIQLGTAFPAASFGKAAP